MSSINDVCRMLIESGDHMPIDLHTLELIEVWVEQFAETTIRIADDQNAMNAFVTASALAAIRAVVRDHRAILTPAPDDASAV